ncbi:polyhydroxyalkanoate synthesis repressor PhaR [Parvularcula dongshanensis]|uniref:Polyhydroxyalkanoate synthesis repressor PhaR n=1 Tax=Parvularcula dongshanensis TaxID=1173995 RepID=A0A840I0J1_9PROT|nr:polyhydroxyalkanoate synthesis repressor PhaR [Parvularcula dongshanensis]MBB4657801.1 polyhydroxyalkanoate synthesis repressor PhaR [Parvularcula dongshanensis]
MAHPQQKTALEGKDDAQGSGRKGGSPTIVKKYANRRLYNTATSSYVTLEHLADMVRREEDFVVVDAKSGEDLTRSVLTQIIFEQENRGENMLPVPFLRQLIGLYGNNLSSFVPSYLEASMDAFAKNQETMRRSMSEAFASPQSGLKIFEDAAKKNMAFFEEGLRMFGLSTPATTGNDDEVRALRAEVERLKAELAARS